MALRPFQPPKGAKPPLDPKPHKAGKLNLMHESPKTPSTIKPTRAHLVPMPPETPL